MATSKAPKSILKKTSYPYPTTPTTTTSRSKEDRDREVALYHANLLQERKNIELDILLSMETLIDYPLSRGPPYSASNPSPTDMQTFKDLLQLFQPSDYDALIVERNINENCGYTLCPNARATDGRGGKYRILGMSGKAKDFRVVERHEVEKWCSEACARRALYVRVQLSESPAWERAGGISSQIDLLDEPKSMQDQIAEDFAKMDLAEAECKMQDAVDLALERGDRGLGAKQGRVDITIQEKDVQRPAQPPSIEVNALGERLDSMHLTLEGHTPNFSSGKNRQHDDLFGDDDEDSGKDWL